MRVLQVTTHVSIGGITGYIYSLSKALEAKGAGVVVASSGGDMEPAFARCGIPHRRLDIRTKFEFAPKVLRSAFAIARIVRDDRIDIIHAHTRVSQVAAALASRMTGVPYVTTCHGYFKKRLRGVVDTWGAKVIAISAAVQAHLRDDLGVDASRIALVYSGVDAKRFSKDYSAKEIAAAKKELGLGGGPVAGTIGRLSPVKGQKYFIEALAQVIAKLPDAQGLVVGTGEEEASLRKIAASLGIRDRVRFVESCPDTHAYLSVMDVFVFPSVQEGLGIALLEALAAGRACVASRIGGIEDIVADGSNGILAGVGDSKAIAEAIVSLCSDEAKRRSMGDKGRALVKEKFTVEAMADGVMKVYRDVVKK